LEKKCPIKILFVFDSFLARLCVAGEGRCYLNIGIVGEVEMSVGVKGNIGVQ
jgi:hypothetical protein